MNRSLFSATRLLRPSIQRPRPWEARAGVKKPSARRANARMKVRSMDYQLTIRIVGHWVGDIHQSVLASVNIVD